MPLTPGTRIGPYEVGAQIGAGGMGEIYRARDTRLDRSVAIKVLPPTLAADPQLRERFEREARAISSLNHPHICTLFDVGHQDEVHFLVLEFLEGETVADRLSHARRLDPKEALKITVEVCDALDTAHRAGIVHRDLKPANVMLTKAGAKLLDFGLAKAAAPAVPTTALSMLPTTPPNLTAQGTILGTFQYMAPEQIEGLEADARTDIFALGALLFEMLTGRTAFEGKTRASLLGAILKDEPPPVSRLQPLAPAALDRVITTCLAKEPDDRYQSARDLLRDLKWIASGAADDAAARMVPSSTRWPRVAWVVAALSSIALMAMAAFALRPAGDTPAASPVRFTIAPPENASFGGPPAGGTGSATQLAVSPDGRYIVFVARTDSDYQIWLRPVDSVAATPIPGTEGGTFPFWSPDSRFIGFFATGKLQKVQITGGPPIVLCDAPSGRGGSWSRDNVILFAPSSAAGTGLLRVSSAGGVPSVVTTVDKASGETNHRWPHFLPDGRRFFYTASTGTCCPAPQPAVIRIASLEPSDAPITLLQAESSVSYASGHLVFARDEILMAQPFDPDARQLRGEAFPLAEEVSREGSRYVSASVSENGTLVYGQSGAQAAQQLTWLDRGGRILSTVGEAVRYGHLALSPDERRVAVGVGRLSDNQNPDIWIIDVARNVSSRVTFDPGNDESPVWSPDGTRIAFLSRRSGKYSLRQKSTSGTAADELLLEGWGSPSDWSADGRFIAYQAGGSTLRGPSAPADFSVFPSSSDVWVLPLFGDRKPFPVAQTEFTESSAVFSPDGRWIAYTSNESGQTEVYVQAFPGGGGKYQVSRDGGTLPAWRGDGRELFYVRADGNLMAVMINMTGEFEAGLPQVLFLTGALSSNFWHYAVTNDGKRFLFNGRTEQSNATPLTVIVNWSATIQK